MKYPIYCTYTKNNKDFYKIYDVIAEVGNRFNHLSKDDIVQEYEKILSIIDLDNINLTNKEALPFQFNPESSELYFKLEERVLSKENMELQLEAILENSFINLQEFKEIMSSVVTIDSLPLNLFKFKILGLSLKKEDLAIYYFTTPHCNVKEYNNLLGLCSQDISWHHNLLYDLFLEDDLKQILVKKTVGFGIKNTPEGFKDSITYYLDFNMMDIKEKENVIDYIKDQTNLTKTDLLDKELGFFGINIGPDKKIKYYNLYYFKEDNNDE